MADGETKRESTADQGGFGAVRTNVILFLITVVSVFLAGAKYDLSEKSPAWKALQGPLGYFDPRFLVTGWTFAVPLLGILLTHEFGHYFAARYHRVPASLPYFIPLPFLSPFGTMGAVIAMRGRIRSRQALLDIGAAGPLAGIVVAIPVLLYGLFLSEVKKLATGPYEQEGQSLLYVLLKWIAHGHIPADSDVYLHPTAMAGWVGFLVTMLNLLPFGQLDGGHIAFALFGERQNDFAKWVRRGLLILFAYNVAIFFGPILLGTSKLSRWDALGNSATWLVWYGLLGLLARLGGRDHPPFEPGPLSAGRKGVGWLCLFLFILLFMPTPFAVLVAN
jgi:membrane-associated protease RseP (regulator of RpoE activity)